MEEYYHVTINDGAPLPTEDDMRETAKLLGISYEDYLSVLDNHIPFNKIYEYVESLHT